MSNSLLSVQPGLNDREAITDLVYRCVMAIDTRDATQLETMFVDDIRIVSPNIDLPLTASRS